MTAPQYPPGFPPQQFQQPPQAPAGFAPPNYGGAPAMPQQQQGFAAQFGAQPGGAAPSVPTLGEATGEVYDFQQLLAEAKTAGAWEAGDYHLEIEDATAESGQVPSIKLKLRCHGPEGRYKGKAITHRLRMDPAQPFSLQAFFDVVKGFGIGEQFIGSVNNLGPIATELRGRQGMVTLTSREYNGRTFNDIRGVVQIATPNAQAAPVAQFAQPQFQAPQFQAPQPQQAAPAQTQVPPQNVPYPGMEQFAQPQAAPAAPQAPTGPPPGFPAQFWDSLTDEQKAQAWAQVPQPQPGGQPV
jgi:hypothetical protein